MKACQLIHLVSANKLNIAFFICFDFNLVQRASNRMLQFMLQLGIHANSQPGNLIVSASRGNYTHGMMNTYMAAVHRSGVFYGAYSDKKATHTHKKCQNCEIGVFVLLASGFLMFLKRVQKDRMA